MKLVIIEDEKLAADRLATIVKEYDESIEIVARLESIEDSVRFLNDHPHPDLLLVDIHLSDGHSFEIFNQVSYYKPIIFTTAFDQYAMDAFKVFSIDYILKPVTLEALTAAMNKLKLLKDSFYKVDLSPFALEKYQAVYKDRFLVKTGKRLGLIDVADVSYFQADNKIVYLVDRSGNKYIIDHTMERLEQVLNPRDFFRLNRRYMVRYSSIAQVKPFFNHRLKVVLKGDIQPDDMIISRERVATFIDWGSN